MIIKYFWKKSFLIHFPEALEDTPSFMQEAPFYFKLNFLVGKLSKLH